MLTAHIGGYMNINLENLTERELSILTEVIKGKTNNEISETFFITEHTVKAHLKNILQKTNFKHRYQLIANILTNLLTIDINSPSFILTLRDMNLSNENNSTQLTLN